MREEPRVVIPRAAHKEPQRAALVLQIQKRALAVDIARLVDRAALVWSFLDVAVGADDAARQQRAPRAVLGLRQKVFIQGGFAAVAGAEIELIRGGGHGNHVDHSADGA
jgi:hypothetical protein